MHPRKVRGGIRLENREGLVNLAWAGQRWMRLVEDCAPGSNLGEGVAYAKLGQTRSLSIGGGLISARVQGRMPQSYVTEIRLPIITHEQWDQAMASMAEQARYHASLLAGEVPAGIEDLFAPLHLRLFPQDPSDLGLSCTCSQNAQIIAAANAAAAALMQKRMQSVSRPVAGDPVDPGEEGDEGDGGEGESGGVQASEQEVAAAATPVVPAELAPAVVAEATPAEAPGPSTPWCKHICCVMGLVAERLSQDPFLIFTLRGLSKDDLLERLRQRRALVSARGATGGTTDRPVAAYSPRIPGLSDSPSATLESALSEFWGSNPDLDGLDLPMQRPEVGYLLLRRLGSSPFEQARFPLVGLLATCYEVLSETTLRNETELANQGPLALGEPGTQSVAGGADPLNH